MKLAKVLGMTAAEVGRRVDADEFALWQAEDRIEPIDGWRQTGTIASAIAALRGGDVDIDDWRLLAGTRRKQRRRQRLGGADLEAHHRALYGGSR